MLHHEPFPRLVRWSDIIVACDEGTMAKGRTFLRGITSERYGLGAFRRAILEAQRVRGDDFVVDDASVGHSGDSRDSRTWWRIGPGDEPFLTQTLQVHFVELPPGKSNHGHGHQNEAVFYILEGTVPAGYPEPGLFQQSMGWVDKDGNTIRYQTIYSNSYHGMGLYPVPPTVGAGRGAGAGNAGQTGPGR